MDDGLTSKRGREETPASPPPMTTFDATQCHIEMLSPEATARATVDFSTLMIPDRNGGTSGGGCGGNVVSVGSTRLASILDTEGFAVVTNVLSAAEVEHAEKLWGSDLMSIVDVRPETAMADPMAKFTSTPWKKEVSAAAKAKKERKKEKRNAARSAHAHNSTSGNAFDEHAARKHQPATEEQKEELSQGPPDGTKRSTIPEARDRDDDEDDAVPSSCGVERSSGTCEQTSEMIESQRAATYMKHVQDLAADPVHRWPLESFPLVARQGVAKFTTDYGLPHGEMAWFCRRHAHVKAVFESIFRTTELCCGFDVIFFNNRPVVVRPNTTVAAADGSMNRCGDRDGSPDEKSDHHCEVNEDVPIARPATSVAEQQSTRGPPETSGKDRSCHGDAAPAASSPSTRSKFGFPAMDTEQPPVLVDNLRALTTTLWPHADQNAHVPPAGTNQVYQSVLYLWPADEASSSTIVWPGSHRTVFPRLMETVNHDRHYCALPAASPESAATVGTVGAATAVNEARGGVDHPSEEESVRLESERVKAPPRAVSSDGELAPNGELPEATREAFVQHARRVPVPPGGMVIWDSRTLHQGWPHGRRLALPIGFEPTSRRSGDVLAAKQRLVLDGVPTDHWGSLGAQHRMARGPGKQKPTPGLTLAHAAHRRAHLMSADGTLRPDVVRML